MRLFLLANVNSIHAQRWAIALANRGIEILFFSLSKVEGDNPFDTLKNIELFTFGFDEKFTKNDSSGLSKFRYLKVLPLLKQKINRFQPDILHAHYLSGYGTLGALSGFHPFVVSVWGSDIFDFPKKSYFHKKLIEFNLKKADRVLSTSKIMAKEINLYTLKDIDITPFGIDMEQFKPMKVKSLFDENDIVIGTVKTLEEKYGIEYLIKAFKILSDKNKDLPLKLLIVGSGSLDEDLKQLTKDLKIEDKTIFTGKVPFIDIPKYHNMLSVSVSVSVLNSESFGVAIIEASSCAKPVVVANVGGLPEVVEDKVTGFIVPPRDGKATADAIEKLILDRSLQIKMGINGRERVKKLFNWSDNVTQMTTIYKEILK